MRAFVFAVSAVAVVSCARAPVAEKAPPVEECTLATPLKPGVPGSPGHLIPSDINPNGASELATLMRTFVKDMTAARELVQKGQPVPALWTSHRKMRCAWPTDLADRNKDFDALAQVYLAQVQTLDAKPAEPAKAYDAVLTACRSCHEASCPGPIEVIEGLRLTAK